MSGRRYAEGTTVPLERSLAEITTTLMGAGCDEVGTRQSTQDVAIMFILRGVAYRMAVPAPVPSDYHTVKVNASKSRQRTPAELEKVLRDERARRVRALSALVRARLTAIAEGITTMEREFFGDIVVDDSGRTIADIGLPKLAAAIESGSSDPARALDVWGRK